MDKFFFLFLLNFALNACSNAPSGQVETSVPTEVPEDLEARGRRITTQAFTALSSRLMQAVKAEGVQGAVSYCKLTALPLIDSLSQVEKVSIRRTSEKYRNPADAPTPQELKHLQTFAEQRKKGEVPGAVVDGRTFYAPILIVPACLKCHGKVGETLAESDYAHILKNYSEDKATGYVPGELRGMWVVDFTQDL